MGLLTFSINVTLDGCVDQQEGIADDETHAYFTRLMDESGAMLWGRVTYEMMESYWPAVARGDEEAPPALREWAVKLEAEPKYVVSSTRTDFPWTNSHHIAGDLRTGVQKLKDATPAGVLLGSGKLATELDRLDLIDEYRFLVQPMIAGHGPTLYQSGLPSTRRLELVSAKPLRNGAVAMHYRRADESHEPGGWTGPTRPADVIAPATGGALPAAGELRDGRKGASGASPADAAPQRRARALDGGRRSGRRATPPPPP